MFCLTQLRTPDSTLKIPEAAKGSWLSPNIFHMKNGLNGRTASTTNFHHGKIVLVCPYHMSSEKVHQLPKTEKTGMCRSSIKKLLSETCSQETQGNSFLYSRNWPLELIPKHGLRSPSVTERTCNIYKLIMMSRQKAHKGNKFLDLNLKKITRMKLLLH